MFRTLDVGLVSRFEGRTFSNSEEKGDYDAKKTASITCEELNRALICYVCDIYHVSPHAGLAGRPPAREWNRLTGIRGAEICPPKDQMCEVFGVSLQRVVDKKGVLRRLFGGFYQCEEITQFCLRKHGTEVQLRVDDRDVTEILMEIDTGHLEDGAGRPDDGRLRLDRTAGDEFLCSGGGRASGIRRSDRNPEPGSGSTKRHHQAGTATGCGGSVVAGTEHLIRSHNEKITNWALRS